MAEKLDEIYVEVSAKLDKLERDFDKAHNNLTKQAGKAGKDVGEAIDHGVGSKVGDITNKLKLIGQAVAGAFVVKKILDFGKAGVQTAMDFELLKSRIASLKGGMEQANKTFEVYKKIAATTPFDLKGLTAAGATMEAFSMDSEKHLKTVANLAAFMGTSAEEAAGAWGRAWNAGAGAAVIFRERGILNLLKVKTGVDDLTKLTLPEFREAMLKTFNEAGGAIASATDTMSKTAVGGISNMKDAWDNFNDAMFKKYLPSINAVARGIGGFIESITPVETATKKATDAAIAQRFEFDMLVRTYKDLNGIEQKSSAQKELYIDTINKLKSAYPEYLGKLDLEKLGYNEVAGAIDKASEALGRKIKLAALEAGMADMTDKATDAKKREYDATAKISELKEKLVKAGIAENELTVDGLKAIIQREKIQTSYGTSLSKIGNLAQDLLGTETQRTARAAEYAALQEEIVKYQAANSADFKEMAEAEKARAAAAAARAAAEAAAADKNEENAKKRITYFDAEVALLKQANELNAIASTMELGQLNTKKEMADIDAKILAEALALVDTLNLAAVEQQSLKDYINESATAWEVMNMAAIAGMQAAGGLGQAISDTIGQALTDSIMKAQTLEEALKNAWKRLAEMAASKAFGIAADLLTGGLFKVTGLGGAIGGLSKFLGMASGGDVTNVSGRAYVKPYTAARGLDMIVPPGFANDSFPVMVQSGERLRVTPANKVSEEGGTVNNNFAYSFSVSTLDPVGFERYLKTDGRNAVINTMKDLQARGRN